MTTREFLSRLKGVKKRGRGWTALCPAHDDKDPSLSIDIGDEGKILLKCFIGCKVEDVCAACRIEVADLFQEKKGRGIAYPPRTRATAQPPRSNPSNGTSSRLRTPKQPSATVQPPAQPVTPPAAAGLTLADYAKAKHLDIAKCQKWGLSDFKYFAQPAVRIPYLDEAGNEIAIRFRFCLEKEEEADNRFKWKKGSKPSLYGLKYLAWARKQGYIALVEGESDCHTLWSHKLPAVGIPGAANWKEDWAPRFDGIDKIYVVIEPDKGGQAVKGWVKTSAIRDRVHFVSLDGAKDPSELHCKDSAVFPEKWQAAIDAAVQWSEQAADDTQSARDEAWAKCEFLATRPRILNHFSEAARRAGIAGERKAVKLLYLIINSRFLPRPVSATVKGPSSAGKSFTSESVLKFFPPSAYYSLSAMSERALAYSNEPLDHRYLVIFEAAGLRGEFANYLVRSLLSEGRLRYETVEKTPQGMRPRLIEREGPTGLLLTTTAVKLHGENETRMFEVPVTDSQDQTRKILRAIASEDEMVNPDYDAWHSLQTWLDGAEHRVTIPFALTLAEIIPPVATRLRRDFKSILNLIRSSAILHQETRKRDDRGRIIATYGDYRIVKNLVGDILGECLDQTVSKPTRETVEAVEKLAGNDESKATSYAAIGKALNLDKSAAMRRAKVAIEKGFLRNLEDRPKRPAKIVAGDPVPSDIQMLPTVAELKKAEDLGSGCTVASDCFDDVNHQVVDTLEFNPGGCTVARESEGNNPPPPLGDDSVSLWETRNPAKNQDSAQSANPDSNDPAPAKRRRVSI